MSHSSRRLSLSADHIW